MLKMRIIPCLDVMAGQVVKGIQFKNHEIVGDIVELAERYSALGADELVFYDITASCDNRRVDRRWIRQVSDVINIPFCVAGGIRSSNDAAAILENGADKVSINSPALENPSLIDELVTRFGSQCVVLGIDSMKVLQDNYVYQYTGDIARIRNTGRLTIDWAKEAVDRGVGEIVLNCMNQDGVLSGYDLVQIDRLAASVNIPVIASGGAGTQGHFLDLFKNTSATGALAASVFHKGLLGLAELKVFLARNKVRVRI